MKTSISSYFPLVEAFVTVRNKRIFRRMVSSDSYARVVLILRVCPRCRRWPLQRVWWQCMVLSIVELSSPTKDDWMEFVEELCLQSRKRYAPGCCHIALYVSFDVHEYVVSLSFLLSQLSLMVTQMMDLSQFRRTGTAVKIIRSLNNAICLRMVRSGQVVSDVLLFQKIIHLFAYECFVAIS